MSNPESSLPPGFRFHPTDEELILHYLRNKAKTMPCPVSIIAEVDIYKFDPWELPAKAMFGEKEWYYFSPRDRKYPNGVRPNRAAVSGYWKATGTDKSIFASDGGEKIIGVKKALVFYRGKPPKGIKTNWIMHEYRLAQTSNIMPMKPKDSSMRLDDRVLCRIYKKSKAIDREEEYPLMQDASLSRLPNPNPNIVIPQKSLSFSDQFNAMDYSDLIAFEQNPILINNTNNNDSNGYLLEGNPNQVNTSPVPVMDNQHKHGRSMSMNTDETLLHPLKKVMNTCSFTDPSHFDTSQYLVNQPFFNQQQLLLSSPYNLCRMNGNKLY